MVVVHYDPPKQAGDDGQEGLLDLDDLPEELAEPAGPSPEPQTASLAGLVGRSLEEIERLFLSETLRACGSNREEAARLLGIGERTLYRKIKEYGL
jgi:two-component system response regulator HydG